MNISLKTGTQHEFVELVEEALFIVFKMCNVSAMCANNKGQSMDIQNAYYTWVRKNIMKLDLHITHVGKLLVLDAFGGHPLNRQ